MQDFEKLGAFYLGKVFDRKKGAVRDELLLYDAKDLTTHAVSVGMTGSGKTGLGLVLLEEAAIDAIPAIAIDPKGDLGNLLLTFPEIRPSDFRAFIDEGEAARKGLSPDEAAARTAETWKKELAEWGQDGSRIARFRDAVDLAIYTPGSSAGLPVSIVRSFEAPPAALAQDADGLRDRVLNASSGLLTLLGIEADPIQSREHILLSQILDRAWREGRSFDLAALIHQIQTPGFDRVGVVDLESFFPAKERHQLAMRLNNLLASPGFSQWLEGEPLDIGSLLYTKEGRPRLSIVSIAHLSDAERMFFVTLLLNEVVSWVRTQPGTNSLRALVYMDEIFGYFPPTEAPPSKGPMLTLLKQARAFGLGVILATQNPVDLDYKGLSNAGTWFVGRLQTEQDKARLLEGLEGAAGRGRWDRKEMDKTLSGLQNRVFLMHNVHEDQPVLFQTRWALSYVRGPLTRGQIQTLMEGRKKAVPAPARASAAIREGDRPVLTPEVPEYFFPLKAPLPAEARLVYKPALLGVGRLHFTSTAAAVDHWDTVVLLGDIPDDETAARWESAEALASEPRLEKSPAAGARFSNLPARASQAKMYASWVEDFEVFLLRERMLKLLRSAALKETSRPGESESGFRARIVQKAREERDAEVEKLRARFAPKLARLDEQIRKAEDRVGREESQYGQKQVESAIAIGSSVLGALFGRKLRSVGNVGRVSSAARSVGRAAREKEDIDRAQEDARALQENRAELEKEFEAEAARVQETWEAGRIELEEIVVRAAKTGLSVKVVLVWTPWQVGSDGLTEVAFSN